MSFRQTTRIGLAIILGLMLLLWLFSLRLKNSSIVDIFWGTGFVIATWVYFALTPDGFPAAQAADLRPGHRLGPAPVDPYPAAQPGQARGFPLPEMAARKPASLVVEELLPGLPAARGAAVDHLGPAAGGPDSAKPAHLTGLDFIGAALWMVGFFFEAMGDFQLTRFKADPANKGKVLDRGVWRYTRHPNYFGDSAQWWGYYLIAASAGGWWTIFSPILMTFLFCRSQGWRCWKKPSKPVRLTGNISSTPVPSSPGFRTRSKTKISI